MLNPFARSANASTSSSSGSDSDEEGLSRAAIKAGKGVTRKKGGAARFTSNSKDKLPKVDLSNGSAVVQMEWNEGEGARPSDPLTGTSRVSVVLTRPGIKGEASHKDQTNGFIFKYQATS